MPYPEHRKLKALEGKNDTVGEFLEWLDSNGYRICKLHTSEQMRDADHPLKDDLADIEKRMRNSRRYSHLDALEHVLTSIAYLRDCGECFIPQTKPIEKWIAEFFGIDRDKLEMEKRAMLDELRRMNASSM